MQTESTGHFLHHDQLPELDMMKNKNKTKRKWLNLTVFLLLLLLSHSVIFPKFTEDY